MKKARKKRGRRGEDQEKIVATKSGSTLPNGVVLDDGVSPVFSLRPRTQGQEPKFLNAVPRESYSDLPTLVRRDEKEEDVYAIVEVEEKKVRILGCYPSAHAARDMVAAYLVRMGPLRVEWRPVKCFEQGHHFVLYHKNAPVELLSYRRDEALKKKTAVAVALGRQFDDDAFPASCRIGSQAFAVVRWDAGVVKRVVAAFPTREAAVRAAIRARAPPDVTVLPTYEWLDGATCALQGAHDIAAGVAANDAHDRHYAAVNHLVARSRKNKPLTSSASAPTIFSSSSSREEDALVLDFTPPVTPSTNKPLFLNLPTNSSSSPQRRRASSSLKDLATSLDAVRSGAVVALSTAQPTLHDASDDRCRKAKALKDTTTRLAKLKTHADTTIQALHTLRVMPNIHRAPSSLSSS